jgi:3-hydroxyisobutyrate dehydrogenase-like beta-hydroxyacid dehydrogenase
MVGGDKGIFDEVVVALNIAAVSEALVLAQKAGVDPAAVVAPSAAAWPAPRCWKRRRR